MPEGRKGRVKDATASVAALLVFFFSSLPPFFLFFFILPTSSVARLGSIPRRFHFEDNSVLDRAILLYYYIVFSGQDGILIILGFLSAHTHAGTTSSIRFFSTLSSV